MNHNCHAHKCRARTDPRLFMCWPHWSQLPRVLQRAVLAAYRPGQERDKLPSAAYMKAAHAAKLYLAEREYPEDVPGLKRLYDRIDQYYAQKGQ